MSISVDGCIEYFNEAYSQFDATKWVHDHPTVVKVAQVAGIVLLGAVHVAALSLLTSRFSVIHGQSLFERVVVGAALACGAVVGLVVVDWFFPEHASSSEDTSSSEHASMPPNLEGDYYHVLGLSCKATREEIREAYKRGALQYHPDRNRGNAQAEAKFKEILQAYEILSDEKKRTLYDLFGADAVNTDFPFMEGDSEGDTHSL